MRWEQWWLKWVTYSVLGQHSLEVAVDDQHSVEQFAADSADPSFGDRVRAGRLHWGAQDADGFAGEHGVEDAGELAVAIPDQEPALVALAGRLLPVRG
ncbi:MAG: hypothetical protein M3308_06160 [Actinomycetota bacterium]|nr:hypothetical protein [Actinomycetota bacterium]